MGGVCSSPAYEFSAIFARAPARLDGGARDDLWRVRRKTLDEFEQVVDSRRLRARKALVYGDPGGGGRSPIS